MIRKAFCKIALFLLVCLTQFQLGALQAKNIVIGAKSFTEQHILVEIASQLLEKNGFRTNLVTASSTQNIRNAIEKGEIDFYFEYNGTAYSCFYNQDNYKVMNDPEKCYQWVKHFDAKKGLIWLDRFNFKNQYAIMLRKDFAYKNNIHSISQLSSHLIREMGPKTIIAINHEFYDRPDGFRALAENYIFPSNLHIEIMEADEIYHALKTKKVDIGMGYSTDNRIHEWDFHILKDDKEFFPVYNPSLVIRKDILERYPEIEDILRPMAQYISENDIRTLSSKIINESWDVDQAAEYWIKNTKHSK